MKLDIYKKERCAVVQPKLSIDWYRRKALKTKPFCIFIDLKFAQFRLTF